MTMSHARREALVALAAKYSFTILADEVYQLLSLIVRGKECDGCRGRCCCGCC